MLGLRDVLLIAPTHSLHQQSQPISSDHHPNLPLPSSTALGVGLGIFPLLTPTPSGPHPHPHPHPQQPINPNSDYWNLRKFQDLNSSKKSFFNVENSEQAVESDCGGTSGTRPCKDCGNKAKKDCGYGRCRTCCKGRGFDCSTHVRSTWVSAARRRERQTMLVSAGGGGEDGSSGSSSAAKRPRVLVTTTSHTSTSIANTPKSFETTSSHQDENFKKSLPGQVRAPAVFRCHRVTAIGNGEAEIIYQVTVRISGHVFKGFLYDQGVDEKNEFPCISSSFQLEDNSISARNGCSASPVLVPANAYQASAS